MIEIGETRTETGYRWAILDWDAYCDLLTKEERIPPRHRYTVSISFDTRIGFEHYHGDFERQVGSLFGLPKEKFKIVSLETPSSTRTGNQVP